MPAQNKSNLFITLENLIKIYQYKNAIIKINRSCHEDHLAAMAEAGVSINDSIEVESEYLDISETDDDKIDPDSVLESSETTEVKKSGAVSFSD